MDDPPSVIFRAHHCSLAKRNQPNAQNPTLVWIGFFSSLLVGEVAARCLAGFMQSLARFGQHHSASAVHDQRGLVFLPDCMDDG
jgi:hypothetical protein